MSWADRDRRLDIIIRELHEGQDAFQIDKMLKERDFHRNLRKGHYSESNFERRVWGYFAWMVEGVEKGSSQDDQNGIDYFVTFSNGKKLPIQVKSSDMGVEDFRNDPRYLQLGKRIIVINSAKYVSRTKFRKHFFSELSRISKLD